MQGCKDNFDLALAVMEGMGLTEAFGHLSERDPADPRRIRITPAFGPGMADGAQCVFFDLDGRRLKGNDELPAPLETPMHIAVYRARADVNAICRTHSPHAVTQGAVAARVFCTHGFSLMLGRTVPVHADIDLIHSTDGAQALADTLGEGAACLIRGNGALAVGGDISRAVVNAIYLEEACRIQTHAGYDASAKAAAGIVDAEFSARRKWHGNEVPRAWNYYCAKYGKARLRPNEPIQ